MLRHRENPLNGHLLNALLVLLDTRSVTQAAQRLNLSQPATSLILRQLREIFDDQLLVRSQGRMVPTERAVMLRHTAAVALEELDGLLLAPTDFNPSECRQTFTIAMPDHILPLLMNRMMQEFRRRAPLAHLQIRALGPDYDFEGALAAGSADIVISNWPTPPPNLMISVLFEDHFVCLVDADHPFTRTPPTQDEYLAASHIAPADYAIRHRGVVETHLGALRLTRTRRIETAYFGMAPYLLPGTDLIFTLTRHYAEHFAAILPLKIIDSPVAYPTIQFYQLWHERVQHSPTHRWLRSLMGEIRKQHQSSAASLAELPVSRT